ncbi:15290_t:CDS:2, partial [Gigaspora margarita]
IEIGDTSDKVFRNEELGESLIAKFNTQATSNNSSSLEISPE